MVATLKAAFICLGVLFLIGCIAFWLSPDFGMIFSAKAIGGLLGLLILCVTRAVTGKWVGPLATIKEANLGDQDLAKSLSEAGGRKSGLVSSISAQSGGG
ncbi:hypothetical protein [Loktanella sp. Alg231-35]|uniref:hypothetical protein n=1 Tax=Loktanella sp. Alg231-35 TaxID=1922220 RepID=UPI000D5511B0|nr:hypothetical protein [Loktanella sp. Alg231-35]